MMFKRLKIFTLVLFSGLILSGETRAEDLSLPHSTPEDIMPKKLTDMQEYVTKHEGTEPAFNNEYWNNHEEGIYVDIHSGEALFSSTDKFDSGTGWPSFTK